MWIRRHSSTPAKTTHFSLRTRHSVTAFNSRFVHTSSSSLHSSSQISSIFSYHSRFTVDRNGNRNIRNIQVHRLQKRGVFDWDNVNHKKSDEDNNNDDDPAMSQPSPNPDSDADSNQPSNLMTAESKSSGNRLSKVSPIRDSPLAVVEEEEPEKKSIIPKPIREFFKLDEHEPTDFKTNKFLIFLENVGLIERRNKQALKIERLAEVRSKLKQKRLESPRLASNLETVRLKFGSKKSHHKSEEDMTRQEKYYQASFMTGRHWTIETWHGIPARTWFFIYLAVGFTVSVAILVNFNKHRDMESADVRNRAKYKHVRYVVQKLNENEDIQNLLGEISSVQVSKMPPMDRANFHTNFITELWVDSPYDKEMSLRMLLIYSDSRTLQALQRVEIFLPHEIIKVEVLKPDLSELNVLECPPDTFPVLEMFTSARAALNISYYTQFIWPIGPLMVFSRVVYVTYKRPVGLLPHLMDVLKNHIIVKRALGSPVYLQSDVYRGGISSRHANIKLLMEGRHKTGMVHVIAYRDGSTRWVFPNAVLIIDDVKNDNYREIHLSPWYPGGEQG